MFGLEFGIITLIFTYALWMVIRYVRKTKQGACASCPFNRSCSSACASNMQATTAFQGKEELSQADHLMDI